MKDQLKLLEQLQAFDAKLHEIDNARKAIPAKLDEMRRDLAKLEDMVARERAELEATEQWHREKDDELKATEQQIAKSKQKATLVKNTKDYMLVQREAETLRKMSVETQEKLAQITEAAGKARARIEAHEGDVHKLREIVAAEDAAANERLAQFDEETASSRAERDRAAQAIDPAVLKRYNTIKMRRGLAVVPVVKGTCRGCHMNIPPQLYIQLQRGSSIEVCPNCHRIVYWDQLLADPDGAPSTGDGPA